MYRNYYLFKRQTDFLNRTLPEYIITQCFTHRKDELVISLLGPGGEGVFLRIGVQIQLPYLLLDTARTVRDPKTEFFPELSGIKPKPLVILPFDKLIRVPVDPYVLEMSFYGQHPNILLKDQDRAVCASFKKRPNNGEDRKHDLYIDPLVFPSVRVAELARQGGDHGLVDFLTHHLGGFNTLLSRELCHRCGLAPDKKAIELTSGEIDRIGEAGRDFIMAMEQEPARIYFERRQPVHLSLIALHHLGPDAEYRIYEDVNRAWQDFIHHHQRQIRFNRLSARLREVIQNRLDYLDRSLASMIEREQLEQKKKEAEMKGNLILTFVSQIPKGAKSVDLPNILSETQEMVRIKLNPAKSAQENATRYFEKFRNLEQKKENASVRKATYLREAGYWKDLAEKLEQTRSPVQVEKIEKELIERGSLQSGQADAERGESMAYSFRRLLLGKKWEVFIGRNAQNNDLLTFRFANKFDLWFHAQGVPGSHVVLRLESRNRFPPPEIIEQTASVAAFFSSAKHSGLVPVNYTQVRYVRKVKNMPAGVVNLSHEKTVMVKPRKFL